MLALLTPALFAVSGIYALLAIAATWRRHGPAVLALRGELAACGADRREVRFRVAGFEMPRPSAEIHRPDFSRPQLKQPKFKPGVRSGLPQAEGWRAAA